MFEDWRRPGRIRLGGDRRERSCLDGLRLRAYFSCQFTAAIFYLER